MYGKCRLHSNGHSKFSYDLTDYWRKMKSAVKSGENPPTPLTRNIITSFSANSQLRHMSILSVHCYEDDIFRTLERIHDKQTLWELNSKTFSYSTILYKPLYYFILLKSSKMSSFELQVSRRKPGRECDSQTFSTNQVQLEMCVKLLCFFLRFLLLVSCLF